MIEDRALKREENNEFQYELVLAFMSKSDAETSYNLISVSSINKISNIEKKLDTNNLPLSLKIIISELLTQEEVNKYFLLIRDNRIISERRFLYKSNQYIDLTFTPQLNNQGKLLFSTALLAEDKIAELRNNLSEYIHITENSSEGLCVIDKDLNPLFSSAKLKEVLGYSPHEPLYIHPLDLVHPDDISNVIKCFKRIKKLPSSVIELYCRLKSKNGYYTQVKIIGKNCLKIKGIQGIVLNIRELPENDTLTGKIDSKISKKTDISQLTLQDLMGIEELQNLMNIFYAFNKTPFAITDLDNNIISFAGKTDVCEKFHRLNPLSSNKCKEESNLKVKSLGKEEYKLYRCSNNLYKLTSPIIIAKSHIANLSIGQFFLLDEEIDYELFRKQAQDYGFNEEEYLSALEKAPRLSSQQVISIAKFYTEFLKIVIDSAHSKIKLQDLVIEIENREDHLLKINDNMTDVVFTSDLNFNLNYVSPSIEKLTGFTPEEYLQLPIEKRYTPQAVKEIKQEIEHELSIDKESTDKNRSNINKLAIYNNKGKIVITSIHSKFLRDQYGNPNGIIANLRNITQQYKVEKALEEQLKLQALISSIAVEFINIPSENIDQEITNTLARIANFFKVDRAYIFDYDWDKRISCNTYEWVADNISPEIDNLQEVPLEFMEYWPDEHKQGKTIIIEDLELLNDYPLVQKMLSAQGIKSLISIPLMNNNICVGFIGFDSVKKKYKYSESEKTILSIYAEMLINIRNRIRLETDLREERIKAQTSDKLKSNLLKNISHEFRTPLNGIVGFSELLQQKSTDFEDSNMASMIYSSAIRLNHVLDSVMLLTQLETIEKRKSTDFKLTCVSKILNDLSNLFEDQFKDKELTFYSEIEPNLFAQVDENLLNQALIHLLNNALKFTQNGGVQVLCSRKDDKIFIDIIDTGIGIPNESLKLIFSEFRQASEGYNRAYEGVGLGLTIAKKIINLMQGEISVTSQILSGSTFSVSLPYKEVQLSDFQEDLEVNKLESIPLNQEKPKILIVEDNTINQKLVISILKSAYSTDLANNGEVAILLAGKKKYDAILMDIHLGEGIDGLTAARLIKKDTKNITTPIIAVTGYTMIGDRDRILAEGCNFYLGKPYKKAELINILQTALNN